jgi:Cdc6-like AAA superfamily ATPase
MEGQEQKLTSSVVLMDELDQLLTAKQDVVYNFFNWPTMRDSQLFVIAVANRMDLPQHLAAKIKSRLGQSSRSLLHYDFRNERIKAEDQDYKRYYSSLMIERI